MDPVKANQGSKKSTGAGGAHLHQSQGAAATVVVVAAATLLLSLPRRTQLALECTDSLPGGGALARRQNPKGTAKSFSDAVVRMFYLAK